MSPDDGAPPRVLEALGLEDVLAEIDAVLNGLTSSAHTRELRAKAETYRAQLAAWGESNPSDAQREALGELLEDLRAKVRETAAKVG